MQRKSLKTLGKVGFGGLLLCGGFAALTTAELDDFQMSAVQAQDVRPQPDTPESTPDANNSKPVPAPDNARESASPAPKAPAAEVITPGATTPRSGPILTPRQTAMLKQSTAEQMKVFRDGLDTANASDELCKDSFDRGLMPLPDFAEQASANLEVRLVIADLQGDRAARVKALSDHVDLMQTAAKQLHDFNQPAAKGWAADMEYASLLASNAQLRLAAARGDKATYQAAEEQSATLADSQFTKRLADFETGQASLSLLSSSASYLTTTSGLPADNREKGAEATKFEEYLSTLDDVVAQTQKFGDLGAGVGREDRLFQAQFELSKATGQAALQKKHPEDAAVAFDKAADSAKDWFDSELKFYQTGTASLRDITQAWWGRAELTDRSERAGLVANNETLDLLQTDYDQVQKIVGNTDDQQGRIAADIAYVNTLGRLDNLWARQRAVQTLAAAKKGATSTGQKGPGGSKIIEINPKTGVTSDPKTIPGTSPTDTQKSKNSTIEIVTPRRKPN
jgi:hypothetical protein